MFKLSRKMHFINWPDGFCFSFHGWNISHIRFGKFKNMTLKSLIIIKLKTGYWGDINVFKCLSYVKDNLRK